MDEARRSMTTELPFSSKARPPLRYHGSKWRLAPWIISFLPGHWAYVEPFGGAAGVLLRKERSGSEVYNDIDGQIVNFFRILRDEQSCAELIRLLNLTPYARSEFDLSYEHTANPIEAARRLVIRCFFGHGTCSVDPDDSNGFRSCDVRAGKSYAREFHGVPAAIRSAAERFRGVTVENLDFRKLIPKFDHSTTCFYVDPPYLQATRESGGKGYVIELCDEGHRQLAWMLHQVKGKALISGYPSSLYEQLYADWHREEKAVQANGQRGAVSRTEVLWMNFKPTHTQSENLTGKPLRCP